jgi:hypothetical protein
VPIPHSVTGASHGQLMKYGVITVDDMVADLQDWTTLYVAGRFHKPVTVFRGADHAAFAEASRLNLVTALAAGLLLLPAQFTLRQLLVAIAGLSYTGDFRMVFGENPLKVTNIVDGQFGELVDLYWPLLRQVACVSIPPSVSQLPPSELWPSLLLGQDTSPGARLSLVAALPTWLGRGMALRARDGLEAPSLQRHPTVPRAAFAAAAGAVGRATSSLASRGRAAETPSSSRGPVAETKSSSRGRAAETQSSSRGRAAETQSSSRGRAAETQSSSRGQAAGSSVSEQYDTSHSVPSRSWALRDSAPIPTQRRVSASRAMLGMAGMAARSAAAAARQPLHQKRSPDLLAAFRRSDELNSDMAARLLRPTLASRVARHAATQSIKGVVSAGPSKTVVYSAAKLRKWAAAVRKPGTGSGAAATLLAMGIAAVLPQA